MTTFNTNVQADDDDVDAKDADDDGIDDENGWLVVCLLPLLLMPLMRLIYYIDDFDPPKLKLNGRVKNKKLFFFFLSLRGLKADTSP